MVELLDNGADVDTAIEHNQSTSLELAAKKRSMNVLRTLLQRGASADHCDKFGVDVYVSCWYPILTRAGAFPSRDVFHIVNEYIALDHTYTWGAGVRLPVLLAAATTVEGPDIDALISYGHNIEGADNGGRTVLFYAVSFGNPSAFFALLAHGADMYYESFSVELMLHETIKGEATRIDRTILAVQAYDAIARHLLRNGSPDLNLIFDIAPESPSDPASIRGRSVTLKQIAEANGPRIETWFLALLRESGDPHLFTKEDKRRLHALRLEGYAQQGCVFGEDQDLSGDDETYQSVYQTNEDGDDDHEGGDHKRDARSTQDASSDAEEEQYWDAEQDLQSNRTSRSWGGICS